MKDSIKVSFGVSIVAMLIAVSIAVPMAYHNNSDASFSTQLSIPWYNSLENYASEHGITVEQLTANWTADDWWHWYKYEGNPVWGSTNITDTMLATDWVHLSNVGNLTWGANYNVQAKYNTTSGMLDWIGQSNNFSAWNLKLPASYIIWKDGSTYYATNGTTGLVDYSGTDASTVIQNAIDASSKGDTIFIKNGIYEISSTIVITTSGVSLIGENLGITHTPVEDAGVIFRMTSNLPDGIIHIYGTSDGTNYTFKTWNTIKNIAFDGDGRTYSGIGINAEYTKMLALDHIQIEDIDGYAIKFSTCHDPVLKNSYIQNCGNSTDSKPAIWITAGYDTTTVPTFINNIFEPCYYGWIHQDSSVTLSGDGVVIGNFFEDDGSKGSFGIITGRQWKISNNKFIGNIAKSYIYVIGTRCSISNNIFYEGGYSLGAANAQVRISADDTKVNANIFLSPKVEAVYLHDGVDFTKVNGNFIIASDYHGIRSATTSGVTYTDISGNTFKSISSRAVLLLGSNNIIKNNIVYNSGYFVQINGGSDNVIKNNELYSVTTPISNSGTDTIIKDNIGYTTENSGTYEITGDGASTSFTVSHGLVATPTIVLVTPTNSSMASATWWVSAKASSTFTITFSTAPASGTKLSFDWYAEV